MLVYLNYYKQRMHEQSVGRVVAIKDSQRKQVGYWFPFIHSRWLETFAPAFMTPGRVRIVVFRVGAQHFINHLKRAT